MTRVCIYFTYTRIIGALTCINTYCNVAIGGDLLFRSFFLLSVSLSRHLSVTVINVYV